MDAVVCAIQSVKQEAALAVRGRRHRKCLPWPAWIFQKNVDAFRPAAVGPENHALNEAIILPDGKRKVERLNLRSIGHVQNLCSGRIFCTWIEPACVGILHCW